MLLKALCSCQLVRGTPAWAASRADSYALSLSLPLQKHLDWKPHRRYTGSRKVGQLWRWATEVLILATDKWWKLSGGLPLFGHIPQEPRLTEAWMETMKDELPYVSIMCLLSPGRLRPSWNLSEDWVLEPCNSRHGSSRDCGFMVFLVWTFQCQLGF